MNDESEVFDCVHCGESSESEDITDVNEATGWWTCPVCNATNGDED